jgi:hypothetical protein
MGEACCIPFDLLSHPDFVRRTLLEAPEHSQWLQNVIQTNSSRSDNTDEIQETVVQEIVDTSAQIDIFHFPEAVQCIQELMQEVDDQLQPEQEVKTSEAIVPPLLESLPIDPALNPVRTTINSEEVRASHPPNQGI